MVNRRMVFIAGVWCGFMSACAPALTLRAAALASLVADEVKPRDNVGIACIVRHNGDRPVLVECKELSPSSEGRAGGLDFEGIAVPALQETLVPVITE